MNVTAIVPSLNPDEKFLRIVRDLAETGFEHIILVDDGSKPDKRIWFEKACEFPQCILLRHAKNLGKGRALKTAMNEYLNRYAQTDVGVVTLDGDGQHAIGDVLAVSAALEEEPNALILGVRDFGKENVPARSRFGNRCTSMIFRLLCALPVSDTQTGLRGIPNGFARYLLDVGGERFEFETNMLLETRRAEVKIREVTIQTLYLEENKSSHFRPIRDSVAIYRLILKYVSSSLLSSLIDYAAFLLLCALFAKTSMSSALSILIATVGARLLSSLCNYAMNRTLIFKSRENIRKTILRYYALCAGQTACSYAGVYLLFRIGCPKAIAKIPVDVLLFFLSFRIQRGWVFRK